ncbi:MAG: 30S ribosomal protein S2 [Candidatus Cloacimonas sp. 4484_209]|nr:MAG: 30S ribosomal protein S2 [Candidatus Cloacimonas sp. 4484_209]
MKDLLEAGAHFGHKVSRWNPKMKKFIFGEKNGIYIIDLQKTVKMLEQAYIEIVENIKNGKTILFVGTKRQAQDIIKEEATKCGAFYIAERWLGGMLTNFRTIRKAVNKLIDFEKQKEEGLLENLPKKELLSLIRKMEKMETILGGVKKMETLPDLLYVIDIKREYIAVHEANILGIPVIAIVDTNTDPDIVELPIPANDDAIRSIRLITSAISQAVIDGKQLAESEKAEDEKKPAEEAKKPKKETVKTQKSPREPKAKKVESTSKKPKPKAKPKKTAVSAKKKTSPNTKKRISKKTESVKTTKKARKEQ